MESIKLLGVQINSVSTKDIIDRIEGSSEAIWIVTANPEILLYADGDADYRATLNRATFRMIDSFGLKIACESKGMKHAIRIPGADLAMDLVKYAAEHHRGVALIGGGDLRSAKPALKRLQSYYPNLRGIAEDGGMISKNGEGDQENAEARSRIKDQNPSILLVGFGHPKQERWIERYRSEFPSVRVFIGVGGTFDYWSGLIPRAPKWMRAIGLEWLYRLFKEPKRWRRIINALIAFPAKVVCR